jgi:hypothetical protein
VPFVAAGPAPDEEFAQLINNQSDGDVKKMLQRFKSKLLADGWTNAVTLRAATVDDLMKSGLTRAAAGMAKKAYPDIGGQWQQAPTWDTQQLASPCSRACCMAAAA